MSEYTLFNGDCLEYMRGMDAGSVDAVITDPPYGVNYRQGNYKKQKWFKKHVDVAIHGDQQSFDPSEFIKFKRVVLFGANNFSDKLPPSRGWVFWDKKPDMRSNDFGDGEFIYTNLDCVARAFRHRWSGVIRDSENGGTVYHPTQKPIILMRWLIENYTDDTDTIFDPFMGSGTTGVACMQLGRNFIGCEIDAGYFAIAEKRISEAAAQPALFHLDAPKIEHTQAAFA